MVKTLVVLFCMMVLSSCVSPTLYHDKAKSDNDGFVVKKLSDKKYRIIFFGNDETSREQAKDFVLLRSAQEAVSNGYGYLVIVRSTLSNSTNNFKRQTSTATEIKVVKKDGRIVYTRDYGTQFGVSSNKYATTRPEIYTTVEFYEGNNAQDKKILIAKDIIQSLTQKYQIKLPTH